MIVVDQTQEDVLFGRNQMDRGLDRGMKMSEADSIGRTIRDAGGRFLGLALEYGWVGLSNEQPRVKVSPIRQKVVTITTCL
jgi:hypothetical protein